MTIPIDLAIRAARLHIAMCDIDTRYWPDELDISKEAAFIRAARAGYKATLEYLLENLEWEREAKKGTYQANVLSDEYLCISAVRPLIAHLDATRPNWRTDETR